MADKRMFTQKIIDSDPFLDMPLSAQALYFHLNMRADDDGFINNPKRIQRTVGASEDDLKLLIMKRFLITFESGVIVIKHWRMHNALRKDRHTPTQYQEELAMLSIKDNGSYTERCLGELPAAEESPAPPPELPAPEQEPPEFGEELQRALDEWIKYKSERREPYKPTGLRNLKSTIRNNADAYGEAAVAELIRTCMAANWKGIIFDRLKNTPSYGGKPKKPVLSEEEKKKQEDAEIAELMRMYKATQRSAGGI